MIEEPYSKLTREPDVNGIAHDPPINAPPGQAKPLGSKIKSRGAHDYFPYEGKWEKGKMHGKGMLEYFDGGKFFLKL